MKQIFIECNMGVAGDMLCGALLDTMSSEEQSQAIETLNNIGLHGVSVSITPSEKCSITGTKFNVNIEHEHHYHAHNSLAEIYEIIDSFNLSENVKTNAKAVYTVIAEAESDVHGKTVADIHLHEVGAKDAIMDIVSACYLIEKIGADRIVVSPITTGFGSVKAAHGILPVPAPATAKVLIGIPTKAGDIEGELCTPTGAALCKHFATEFSADNTMTVTKIGYGMGNKDFEKPNCVRVMIGDTDDEEIYELRCQIDDMTGEEMGYAINKLIELGANDAFVQSIVMKKSRPAMALTVICTADKKDYFTTQVFKHTTTLGVRQVKCTRKALNREIIEINGVDVKKSTGFGTQKNKIEFDQLAKIADEKDISIFEARKTVE